jgi:hypothetical protein
MIPLTVVDNFYDNPFAIREFALAQDFFRSESDAWPGLRTKMLLDIDKEFYNTFVVKVLNLFFTIPGDDVGCNFDVYFQSVSNKYRTGWVHKDFGVSFTGIIYLNPDAPLTSGTSMYSEKYINTRHTDHTEKFNFYNNILTNEEIFDKATAQNNSKFVKTADILNVFNRLTIIPGDTWHNGDGYYGTDLSDSRLTQVFFVELNATGTTRTPVTRLKEIKV